jgi:hypothetical protein
VMCASFTADYPVGASPKSSLTEINDLLLHGLARGGVRAPRCDHRGGV